jgi:UDP-glucose 4-epimerase
MEKVLISGASGFVGRALCRHIRDLDNGPAIVALNRRVQDGPWDRAIETDLSLGRQLSDEVLAGVDTVFHLASKAHAVSERLGSDAGYREVIIDGTRRLVEAAESTGCQRFIYVSSVKAMGEGNRPGRVVPMDESLNSAPASPYGLAKLEAERLVLESRIPHAVVLRPVMVYGPNHKGNLVRMVEAVRKRRFPPLPETGNRRSMVHVADLASALASAARVDAANRRVFIITEDDALSTRQLFDEMRVACGMSRCGWSIPQALLKAMAGCGDAAGRVIGRRFPFDSSALEKLVGSAWYDNQLAKDVLDWQPQHRITDFLAEIGTARNLL